MSKSEGTSPWFFAPLSDLTRVRYGKSLDKSLRSDTGVFPVVGSAGVMTKTDVPLMSSPCIVVGRKGNVGAVQFFRNGCYPIDTVYYFETPANVDVQFLSLNLEMQELKSLDSSTAIPSLRREDLEKVQIPLPPLTEQRRIVEILEEQFSRLDAALASIRTVRENSVAFRRSFLDSYLNPNPVTGLPQDWISTSIGEVSKVVGGNTPSKFEQRLSESARSDREMPFFKVGDMNASPRFMENARVFFAPDEAAIFKIEILRPGTIVFPKRGGAIATNKKRVLQRSGGIDVNCMAVVPSDDIEPDYLYWYFESVNISDLDDGSVIPQIGKRRVNEMRISLPRRREVQRRMVDEIEAQLSRHEAAATITDQLETRLASARRSLLHAAFTGGLSA